MWEAQPKFIKIFAYKQLWGDRNLNRRSKKQVEITIRAN